MVAERNRAAQITAVDWPHVLEIATENARKHEVAERHTSLGGDAFAVDFGGPYDLVLVTNFFHHFALVILGKSISVPAGGHQRGEVIRSTSVRHGRVAA